MIEQFKTKDLSYSKPSFALFQPTTEPAKIMFNATEILTDNFVEQLKVGYRRTYGGFKHDYEDIICWAGNMAMENIANSDALYHNVEHTILVTLVGQEILRGKHKKGKF